MAASYAESRCLSALTAQTQRSSILSAGSCDQTPFVSGRRQALSAAVLIAWQAAAFIDTRDDQPGLTDQDARTEECVLPIRSFA